MRIHHHRSLHVTYCMNVHPAETWAETDQAIRSHPAAIKAAIAPDRPFGLGLRLGDAAVSGLLADGRRLSALRAYLRSQGLYVFTINGFPYGRFHGAAVKQAVYRPDWRTERRRDYTIRLAEVLARLLPEGVSGSISTLPGSYRAWVRSAADVRRMIRHLMDVVARLVEIRLRTARVVHLGLEPEPDCWLETTADVLAFFNELLPRHGAHSYLASLLGTPPARAAGHIRRHLGVCLDTCHLALQFETPLEALRQFRAHGIRVSKVQLSSALRVERSAAAMRQLAAFCDPVYLHQTRVRGAGDRLLRFPDLPDALARDRKVPLVGEWRVHYHVPLYMTRYGVLNSTGSLLSPAFFKACRESVEHLEIETYTFGVLPDDVRQQGVRANVVREYQWVLERLKHAGHMVLPRSNLNCGRGR